MARIKNVDVINGNLFRSIVIYSIPIMLINLVQNLFNSVDIMVLGYVADTNAVASVGATTAIVSLMVHTFFGISSGSRVVLARFLGEGHERKIKRTVSTSLITAALIGIFIAVLGIALAKPFLIWTDCPQECIDGARLYIQIYMAAAPAMLLYNFGTAVLNVSGDTQRPLYYMLISGVLNVALNFLLCFVLPQKVAAVAISTAVSQIVGAVLVMRRLCAMEGVCRIDLRKLQWSKYAFRKIMYNGIPIALATALYPFSNLQIQSQVNALGTAAMAGNTATASIEGFVSSIANAPFGSAVGVFVGQNLGAKNEKRVKRSILYCLGLGVGIGAVLSVLSIWYTRPLASLYVHGDAAALTAAMIRRKYVLGIYFLACYNGVMGNVIQAFGYSVFSTANNIISVLGFRFFWTYVIYPSHMNFDWLCLCYSVSWTLVAIFHTSFFMYVYFGKYKKGKLKKM